MVCRNYPPFSKAFKRITGLAAVSPFPPWEPAPANPHWRKAPSLELAAKGREGKRGGTHGVVAEVSLFDTHREVLGGCITLWGLGCLQPETLERSLHWCLSTLSCPRKCDPKQASSLGFVIQSMVFPALLLDSLESKPPMCKGCHSRGHCPLPL